MVVVGCSPARWAATVYLPQLVSIGSVLSSDSASSWMRVLASPFSSNTASSRRCTMVSMWPRACAGSVAIGTPLNVTVPVNGCESWQKKPAGIGSLAKFVLANPATVIHMSTPLCAGSAANAAEPATQAKTKPTPNAARSDNARALLSGFLLIACSFPGTGPRPKGREMEACNFLSAPRKSQEDIHRHVALPRSQSGRKERN